jgi:hypothetical protein
MRSWSIDRIDRVFLGHPRQDPVDSEDPWITLYSQPLLLAVSFIIYSIALEYPRELFDVLSAVRARKTEMRGNSHHICL